MNPFQYGNIVSGDFFYDREEELLRIKQTLKGGNNLMLYAPRRYGKSSLVAKAMKELNKEGMTTVYVDFMSIYSRETFIKNYTRAIAEQQGSTLEKATKKLPDSFAVLYLQYRLTISETRHFHYLGLKVRIKNRHWLMR